jgi:nucleotidyltransferase substrate binding protein (TIGR01987 family)
MSDKRLKSALQSAQNALDKLNDALTVLAKHKGDDMERPVVIDATIKRFEVLFEYAWKLLKVAAEYQGTEAPGPRPAIQEAVRFGWIKDPEQWSYALDARNGSVHDYFGITISEYLQLISKFAKEAASVLKELSKLEKK